MSFFFGKIDWSMNFGPRWAGDCSRMTYLKSGTYLGKNIDPNAFTDVPLVREDDQKIPAHSIVLSLPNGVSEIDPKYHHLVGKIFSNTQRNQTVYAKTYLNQPHCSLILGEAKT